MSKVEIGSLQHLLPILVSVILSIVVIGYANKKLNRAQQEKLVHRFAQLIWMFLVAYHLVYIYLGGYDYATDLPLFLCSFVALIIPVFTYYKKYWMFEILFFWVMGGSFLGVLTPDIPLGFPSFDYFRYWLVHLGLVMIILYYVFVLKYKPNFESVVKSILCLQVYVGVMMLVNYVLDGNYSYLTRRPEAYTFLDYFGVWPYYILYVQLFLIPYFLVIYSPFYVLNKTKS
ncbi:MAG: hypothetical protein BM564_10620 [Bacteroidetes bacterium MedPE-SWsnd-G2]|nr:MAG: hypothetical protein BM564_10620 [Bacteroidetes bacterium MedPE-SWsnd-G2]